MIARLRRMLVILRWGDFRLVAVRARLRFVAVLLVRVAKASLAAMLTLVLRVIFLTLLSRAEELLRLRNVMRIEGPAVAREVGAGKVWVVLPVHGRTMVELLLLLGVALALVFAVILLVVVGRSRLSVERRLVLIVVEAALRLIAIIVLLVEALLVVL